ncbi:MAG TPA: VOC family protein, partial [Pseudonocardiaceae bacterium]
MIGRLEKTVFDCPDPRALAAFYAEALGMRINEDSPDWVVIGTEPGQRQLAFQRVQVWPQNAGVEESDKHPEIPSHLRGVSSTTSDGAAGRTQTIQHRVHVFLVLHADG